MPLLESIKKYEDYNGISPKPKDFDNFWKESVKKMENTDFSYELKQKQFAAENIEVFDLTFRGMSGNKITCELVKPVTINKKIPGITFFHGYKSNIGSIYSKLPYAYNDMAVLAFDVPGQGGKSDDNYTAAGPSLYGQIIRGVDDKDPNNLFYVNIYLDALKAIMIFKTLDFIDENKIGTTGKSQGGALSLVTAALDNDIKLTAPIYPFLADFKKVFDLNLCSGAYGEFRDYFRKYDPLHKSEDDFFERLGYIDVQNFANKIKAEALWFIALEDKLCHPLTQFSVYNKLKCKKDMIIYPEYEHEDLLYSDDTIFEYFKKNI